MILISGLPSIHRRHLAKQISNDYHYCYTDYSLPRVDYGILDTVEYKRDYQFALDKQVLGGTFSKVFIEQLQADVPVEVLNIIRNPSTMYACMNIMADELVMDVVNVTPLVTSSVLDCITLSKMANVTTVRYEDILQTGQFVFGGKVYTIPYTNYNGNVTRYEKVKQRDIDVDAFNNAFMNFNSSFVNQHNDARLPKDIFKELGYQPLTHKEIFNDLHIR